MAIKARDYFKNYGYDVGYDEESGGILITDASGVTRNIGNSGLKLKNGSYYAQSRDDLNNLLVRAGVGAGKGMGNVRTELSNKGDSVGWIDTGQSRYLNVNGKNYNPDDGNFINLGGTLYAHNNYIDKLHSAGRSKYEDAAAEALAEYKKNKFSYDPASDKNLAAAQELAMQKAQQKLNSQGVLNSSLNALYTQAAAQDLIPEYEEKAFEKYKAGQEDLASYIESMQKLANEENSRRVKNIEFVQNAEEEGREQREDLIDSAYKRSEFLGKVDKDSADILDIEEGTLSQSERERQEDFEDKMKLISFGTDEEMRAFIMQKEIEFEYYEKKGEFDFEKWKEEIDYERMSDIQKAWSLAGIK